MPAKLIGVIVLFGLGIVLNLVTQSWLSAALGGLLVFFLVRGSHTARSFAIWLTVAALVVLGIQLIQLAISKHFALVSELALAALVLGGVQGGYALWALTRADVIAWMDERHAARPVRPRGDEPPRYV